MLGVIYEMLVTLTIAATPRYEYNEGVGMPSGVGYFGWSLGPSPC